MDSMLKMLGSIPSRLASARGEIRTEGDAKKGTPLYIINYRDNAGALYSLLDTLLSAATSVIHTFFFNFCI